MVQRYSKNSKFWVFCYSLSNKTDTAQNFESNFLLSGMKFQDRFKRLSFCFHSAEFWVNLHTFKTRKAILMTTSCVFITSDYIITF